MALRQPGTLQAGNRAGGVPPPLSDLQWFLIKKGRPGGLP